MPGESRARRKRKASEAPAKKPATPALERYEYYDPDRRRTVVRWGRPRQVADKRSDLGMPGLVLDRVDYKSTVTGRQITSRNAHRDELREHDLVEVGNENMQEINAKKKAEQAREFKRSRLSDIAEAYAMAEQGYQAPPVEHADDSFANVSTDQGAFSRAAEIKD